MRDKNKIFYGDSFLAIIYDDGTINIKEKRENCETIRLQGDNSICLEDELQSIPKDYVEKSLLMEIDKILGEYMPLWRDNYDSKY